MKKFISFLLVLVICVHTTVSLSTTASAAVTGVMQDTSAEGNGKIYWELTRSLTTATLKISGDGYMPNGTDQCWKSALGNRYITQLIIEEGVKSIMEDAFYNEIYLTEVSLPDSIEFIGDYAFSGTSITSVTLPKNLCEFNGTIFSSNSITQYRVSSKNRYFKAVDGVVYSKDLKTLVAYPIGRFVSDAKYKCIIPDTVTEIAANAFVNSSASTYTIPGNVKSIQRQAFAGNSNLSDLVIENGVKNIYDGAFLACDSLTNIHLPASVKYIGYCTFGYVYELDYEGIVSVLNQNGINPGELTASNVEYYLSMAGYSIDQFLVCVVNNKAKIYAPKNSAGHEYATQYGVKYVRSEAITPKLLSATSTPKGVSIKWRASSDAAGYYVYRKDKSGKWKNIAKLTSKSKTSYTDTSPYNSYKNTYTVKAYSSTGSSRYSEKGVSVYYLKTPKLSSVENTKNGVKVSWGKVSNAQKYNVYRMNKGQNTWSNIGSVSASKNTYTDDTAKNGKVYYYTVRAYDSNGASSYDANGITAKFVSAPKISSVKNTSAGVRVEWKKVSSATAYRIYRKKSNGSWELIKKVGSDTRSFTDKNVKSGTTYSYLLKAENGSYISAFSSGKTIKFLGMPKIFDAKTAKSGITVKYNKITGASGYKIYRKVSGADSWENIATVKGNTKLSFKDTTAKKGTTYRYTVRAYNGSYLSAYSNTGYKIKDKY